MDIQTITMVNKRCIPKCRTWLSDSVCPVGISSLRTRPSTESEWEPFPAKTGGPARTLSSAPCTSNLPTSFREGPTTISVGVCSARIWWRRSSRPTLYPQSSHYYLHTSLRRSHPSGPRWRGAVLGSRRTTVDSNEPIIKFWRRTHQDVGWVELKMDCEIVPEVIHKIL